MLLNQRLFTLGVLMAIVAVIALVACGDAATPEPQIVTERVEVPVTQIVTETEPKGSKSR